MRIDRALRLLVVSLAFALAGACAQPTAPLAPVPPEVPPPATTVPPPVAAVVETAPMSCRGQMCELTVVTPENKKRLEDMAKVGPVTVLFVPGTTDAGLASVAAIPWIETVILQASQPVDLAPLRQLTRLKKLDVMCAGCIADPAQLGALTGLETLFIVRGSTTTLDLHTLGKLTKLRDLTLTDLDLRGLSALADLPALVSVVLNGSTIDDLGSLGQLRRLTLLSLVKIVTASTTDDFAWLAKLTQLERLHLDDTSVADLAPLTGLTSLQELSFSFTKVRSVEPLRNLQQLRTLMLNDTPVSDLRPLAGLPALSGLYINDTFVKALEPAAALPRLVTLEAHFTPITDLRPLAKAKKLEVLDLDGTKIRSLAPLAGLPQLYQLRIRSTAVTDLRPLAKVPRLHRLRPPASAPPEQLAALKTKYPELQIETADER